MTRTKIFSVRNTKKYDVPKQMKVKLLTNRMKNFSDKKVIKHYTSSTEGYQIKVVWSYKCKNGQWFTDALGTSFKPLSKNGRPIVKLSELPINKMIHEADEMAWLNYKCSPTEEFRSMMILEHYIIAKSSNLDTMVTPHRQRKDNIKEFESINRKFDINQSYDYNKKLAKADGRKIINQKDFGILRKIINNEKIDKKDKYEFDRVKKENKNYIDLIRKVSKYRSNK
jgi:hypothetical protein